MNAERRTPNAERRTLCDWYWTKVELMTHVDHMNYRHLGKTGVKVSELCLGAMTFGRQNEATEEESFQMMDRFVAAGGNFIDTANVYSTGKIGRAHV